MFFLNEAYKLHMVVVISNQFSFLANLQSDVQVSQEPLSGTYGQESHSKDEEDSIPHSPGLRRRFV